MHKQTELQSIMRLNYYAIVGLLAASLLAALVGVSLGIGEGTAFLNFLALALPGAALLLLVRLRRLVLGVFRDYQASNQSRARALSVDEVTGAMTRRAFIEACEARLKDPEDANGAILMLVDMDHLKQINDSHGHDMGDAALRHLVMVAKRAAPNAILGRMGGDEFALLIDRQLVDRNGEFAAGFLQDLAKTVYHAGRPLNISASIGIAVAPEDSVFFNELMHFADLALYESKRNGRSQSTLFDIEMLRDRKQDRFIERELRAAILLNELELVYQPLVKADASLHGCEALVRWRHPVRGVVPPSEFVPIAEQTLLIDLLGEWVFRKACRDAREASEMLVGVNFSASQFKRDDVVRMVESVLAETGMPATRVVIEITESVAMSSNKEVLRRLCELRELGIRISLDDFGAGHSGFSYLRSFPVDSIKIDRSFVSKLGESDVDNALVSALASMAKAMGIAVVAEGVETEGQKILARAAGCRYFQGYHVARPQPWAQIRAGWLHAGVAPVRAVA